MTLSGRRISCYWYSYFLFLYFWHLWDIPRGLIFSFSLILIFGPTGGGQNGSQNGQKPSFSDLAEILHPEQFLGPEFENEVRFWKKNYFDPENGKKCPNFGRKTSSSDLAEILHPDQFLGAEFENVVRF